ncbi:MAG: nucleotidyltransferase domain-containing protein [Firmicutes bacterium]|nr:nucleotidyltransferase domain-containing protein [Bacillota bacterium]
MDKAAVTDRLNKYVDLVRDCFPVQKVILFGSYAKGTAGECSDIDVAVYLIRSTTFWSRSINCLNFAGILMK